MSLGSWDPKINSETTPFDIDITVLKRFVGYATGQQLDQLSQLLNAQEQQRFAAYMQLDGAYWQQSVVALSSDEIEALMRFFTVAEQLAGWEAGAKSPVIPLGRMLKQRAVGINRELTLWIKAHSNNQYLPHGPL
jgi:hypothetical protein